jgi:putative NADH-flavin reductase
MSNNIIVLGATGATGEQVLRQGMARGHRMTALARRPVALAADAALTVVRGDVTKDESALAEAMAGCEVVISALGRGNSFKSDNLFARSLPVILPAMAKAGVRRLLFVSAFGVGPSRPVVPLLPRLMQFALLRHLFADKEVADAQLRSSSLEWTIVYPVVLTNGPLTGKYRAAENLELHGVPTISRADVAHFLLDEVERRAFVRKGPIVAC